MRGADTSLKLAVYFSNKIACCSIVGIYKLLLCILAYMHSNCEPSNWGTRLYKLNLYTVRKESLCMYIGVNVVREKICKCESIKPIRGRACGT